MSRIENLRGLLRLLKASDGELETRIRIQKAAFLFGLKYPDIFDVKDFEYHYYGPYSRSLSGTLQFAVSSDIIDESDQSPSDRSFTKYNYSMTERGNSLTLEFEDESTDFVDFASFLKSFDWRALELASTVKFIEIKEGLERSKSIQKALKLKPKTEPYKDKAIEVLERL